MLFFEQDSKFVGSPSRFMIYEIFGRRDRNRAKHAKWTRLGYSWAIFLRPSSRRFKSGKCLQGRVVSRRISSVSNRPLDRYRRRPLPEAWCTSPCWRQQATRPNSMSRRVSPYSSGPMAALCSQRVQTFLTARSSFAECRRWRLSRAAELKMQDTSR